MHHATPLDITAWATVHELERGNMTCNVDRRGDLDRGLKAARKKTELGATAAAHLIALTGIKCGRGTLLAWERGNRAMSREPFASDLPIIAEVYCCNIGDFFISSDIDEEAGLTSDLYAIA